MSPARLLAYWPVPACLLLASGLFWLHPTRQVAALLIVLIWFGGCYLTWRQYRRAQRAEALDAASLLIAYASQGGQARALAERSAEQLQHGGLPARAVPLNALTPTLLADRQRLLLVLGTCGEGEAPDNAARFERQLMHESTALHGLEYAVLALGDSAYQQFCGFARRLEQRLHALGARPLFERLEADRLDPDVLRRWQQQLAQLSGETAFHEWQPVRYQPWRLEGRECLNPGSLGAPVFALRLTAHSDVPHWQAGDIAEIRPGQPPGAVERLLRRLNLPGGALLEDGQSLAWHLARRELPRHPEALAGRSPQALVDQLPLLPHRDYSIASIPADGRLELLVRLTQQPDGSPGLGSGWLCRHAPYGADIDVRIRANPGFRLDADAGPLILIGNGTGLAGLLAHLRERQHLGQPGHWLLFGERSAAHDGFFTKELLAWRDSGHLARLDLAFSRDQAERIHVQHLLRDAADELRAWVERGASLLVCGSLDGMGRAVDGVLRELLGTDRLEDLTHAGRYRRDLY